MASLPCPICGTVNQPAAKFCARCGKPLTGTTGPVAAPSQPTASVPPPSPPAAPTPPVQQTAPVPPPSLQPPRQTAPVPPPASSASTQIVCSNCGKPNRQGARRCAFCGTPLQPPVFPLPQSSATAPVPPPIAAQTPPAPRAIAPRTGKKSALGISTVLLACLILSLCGSLSGIFVYETTLPSTPTLQLVKVVSTATFTPPPPPTAAPIPTNTPTLTPNPPNPVVAIKMTNDGRFGFRTTVGDPGNPKDDNKPLTYRQEHTTDLPDGNTNNTRIWVDNNNVLFGGKDGQFVQPPRLGAGDSEMLAVWQYGKIVITQTVQVVLSASTHRLDTFRIAYVAENRDTVTRTVGVRFMMDTLIGDNDGVPFNVPGRGMITSPLDLRGADIPNFVQVYENPNPNDPGVIVQLTLTGGDATTPDRFVIAPWCRENAGWDFLADVGGTANRTLHQCGDAGIGAKENKLDSAVGIFFDPKPLKPGETREWVTFYGLGAIQKPPPDSSLSLPKLADRVRAGEEFWVVALIQNPRQDQKVRITLPTGLSLTQNPQEQSLRGNLTLEQVSWRVRATSPGNNLAIVVELSPENQQQSVSLSVMALPTPTVTATSVPCTPSVTRPVCP